MRALQSIVKRINFEMGKKEWTHRQLAKKADVHQTTLSRILDGSRASMSVEVLEKVAKAFQLSPAAFFQDFSAGRVGAKAAAKTAGFKAKKTGAKKLATAKVRSKKTIQN